MRAILRLAFGIVVAIWIVAEVSSYFRTRQIAADVQLIGENVLTTIRLVERMGMDIERWRILMDEHVVAQRPDVMDRLERAMADNRRDYEDARREYLELPMHPGEPEVERRLDADVAALEGPVAEVLALSRHNQGAAARARIDELEPRFVAVENDVDELVRINRDAATRAEADIRALQTKGSLFRITLTVIAVIVTLALGAWTTRVVARHEQRLREDAEALEQMNRELDAFSGRVAHDLRGPLSTINLAASALAKQAPAQEPTVAVLQRSVTRMQSIIEGLLKLSRVGAVAPEALAEPHAVAVSVEEDLQRRVKEIDGVLHVDVEPASVRCDEGFLREILWNLGENAVKYRRKDAPATIEVTGRTGPSRYELRVTDNGVGMSAEDARRIFDPFFRGKGAQSTPGTGLGLSIVKRAVEASGGRVAVESSEGEGTTFIVELPLAGSSA